MAKKVAGAAVVVLAACASTACGSARPQSVGPPATAAHVATTATGGGATTTTTVATPASTAMSVSSTEVVSANLPISVSSQLTSYQQDSSVLSPSTCQLSAGVVTARGTVRGSLPEVYARFGDVVELYAYSTAADPPNGANDVQVLDLASETPGRLAANAAWQASAPVETGFPQPVRCFVAVQSTHAFMGAGSAGG